MSRLIARKILIAIGFLKTSDFTDYLFFPPKGGVGLVPKRGYLLTLAYYAFPRWYEFRERQWNGILTGEKRRTRRKTCSNATLSTTNPTWIDPGADSGLHGERPATNNLSHGTAPDYLLVSQLAVSFAARLASLCYAVTTLSVRNRGRWRTGLHPLDDTRNKYGALIWWYWQEANPDLRGEKPVTRL
jgi:hypothetical protein